MKASRCQFQSGDKVQVKKGIIDPDFDFEISGWTGKIKECFLDENSKWLCSIVWDEQTLHKMGRKFINKCDRLNFDHTEMNLEDFELMQFAENTKTGKTDAAGSKSFIRLILQRITKIPRGQRR